MSTLMRELVAENPMMNEAQRAVRRFLHTSNSRQRSVSQIALYFLGFIYVWLLILAARTSENMTVPLLMLELTLVTLIIPTSIYNAISGEREKATWEALILTRLTPTQIIFGKMLWRIVIALSIMALFSLPLVITQLCGTRSPTPPWSGMLIGQVAIFAWAVFLCSYGLFVSAMTKRSVTTIAIIIGSLLFTMLLLPSLFAAFGYSANFTGTGDRDPFVGSVSQMVYQLNPYMLIGKATEEAWRSNLRTTPQENVGVAIAGFGALLYSVGAIVLTALTYFRLRRLESPQRSDK